MTLSEAAARLSRAAIAMKKRREKDALARKHQKKVAAFFRRQKVLTLDALGQQEYLFHESFRHLSEETTELTIIQWDRIWEEIARNSNQNLQTIIAAAEADGLIGGAEQLRKALPFDPKTTFSLANPRAVQWFAANGGSVEKIRGIQDTTRDQMQAVITKAIDEGWSYNQTAKEISGKFDGFTRERAQRIAVFETGSAYEQGNKLFAQSLEDDGIVMEEQWVTSHDEKVRPEHAANEAEGWVEIGHVYSSGDTDCPTDPGCRCYKIYREAPRQA